MQSKVAFALIILCSLFANQIFAQGKGKGLEKANQKVEKVNKKGQKTVKDTKVLDDSMPKNGKQKVKKNHASTKAEMKEKMDKKAKEKGKEKIKVNTPDTGMKKGGIKEKSNNGNAYGKDKAGMTGKEFGKVRSEAAKAKVKEKQAKTKAKVKEGSDKASEARTKINDAKINLAKSVKEGKISEADAKVKEAKIKRAEEQLEILNQSIKKGKNQIGGN